MHAPTSAQRPKDAEGTARYHPWNTRNCPGTAPKTAHHISSTRIHHLSSVFVNNKLALACSSNTAACAAAQHLLQNAQQTPSLRPPVSPASHPPRSRGSHRALSRVHWSGTPVWTSPGGPRPRALGAPRAREAWGRSCRSIFPGGGVSGAVVWVRVSGGPRRAPKK